MLATGFVGSVAALSGWVPFAKTMAWIALIVGVLIWQRTSLADFLTGLSERVTDGKFALIWRGLRIEFAGMARGVPNLKPGGGELHAESDVDGPEALETAREELAGKGGQRGVHLAHVVTPSKRPGQKYDIFVYLVGWARERFGDPPDLSDIEKAEFWLGPKFAPSGQTVLNQPDRGDRRIGITTSAYGPVLCMCRVTFTGGHTALLSRYLDFEAGELLERATKGDEE